MCVSNGECEDIENAFHNAMWDRLHRYYCKYLEKQGEQKLNPVLDIEIPFGAKDSELEEASYHIPEGFHAEIEGNRVVIKKGEQKPVDKVEPKFKVGDFIANDYCFGKVIALTDDAYLLDTGQGIPFSCEHNAHLWTIQDAKDGDVLATEPIEGYHSPFVAIYKKQNEEDFDSYCFIGFDGKFCKGENGHSTEGVHPATKEQRDLLFRKMKEAGYEWNSEKKELKKIEKKPTEDVNLPEFESYLCLMLQKFRTKGMCTNGEIIDYVKEHSQKLKDILVKPAWSEEDESYLNTTIAYLKDAKEFKKTAENCINWLKSIKDRVRPKQEWSEEDKAILEKCVGAVKSSCYSHSFKLEAENWLKSLRPQNRWKPSDEQMEALKGVQEGVFRLGILESLYQDLKKLKEG